MGVEMTGVLVIAVLFSPVDRCRMSAWNATMRQIQISVRQFELEYGRMPTDAEGLQVLVERPTHWSERKEWMPFLETMPRDKWGHDLRYVRMPAHEWGFGVYSTGADGVTLSGGNDRDDINSWDPNAPWVRHYEREGLNPWIPLGGIVITAAVAVSFLCSRSFLKAILRRKQDGSARYG